MKDRHSQVNKVRGSGFTNAAAKTNFKMDNSSSQKLIDLRIIDSLAEFTHLNLEETKSKPKNVSV